MLTSLLHLARTTRTTHQRYSLCELLVQMLQQPRRWRHSPISLLAQMETCSTCDLSTSRVRKGSSTCNRECPSRRTHSTPPPPSTFHTQPRPRARSLTRPLFMHPSTHHPSLVSFRYSGTTTTGQTLTNGVAEVTITQTVTGATDGTVLNAAEAALIAKYGAVSQFTHIMYCIPPGTSGSWIAYVSFSTPQLHRTSPTVSHSVCTVNSNGFF